jgi:hypothetical protein
VEEVQQMQQQLQQMPVLVPLQQGFLGDLPASKGWPPALRCSSDGL